MKRVSSGSSTHAVSPSAPGSSCILGAAPTGYSPMNELVVVCQLCNHASHIAKSCKVPDDSFKPFSAMTLMDPSKSSWYPNSGATTHITPHQANLSSVTPYKGSNKIIVNNCSCLPIAHVGFSIHHTNSKDNLTGKTLLFSQLSSGLYSIPQGYVSPASMTLVACVAPTNVWHSRLCHPHPRLLLIFKLLEQSKSLKSSLVYVLVIN
ncbi:hypothetical protein ACH5RR_032328 [Cinchona calisaya]|uniref:Uncharacterized protein n=1 Tax=Cinchona calisaya TaxID=153742 RepID=A0ABD2YHS8_9GENT